VGKYVPVSERFQKPDARYTAYAIPGQITANPTSFDFNYTTPAPYCKADKLSKGKCTVQLNFIKGEPVLRLCSARGQPGRVIPLTDATAARKIAKAACKSFDANKMFPEIFDDTRDEDTVYDPDVEEPALAGFGKARRRQPSSKPHDRSERLWAAVESARTKKEREAALEAAEAYDARLAGTGGQRMMTLSLAGVSRRRAPAPMKRRASKLKWCVVKTTKAGRRTVSCHKLKRTATAAAKRKGKGSRVVKVRK
jgi:hypothetical protein